MTDAPQMTWSYLKRWAEDNKVPDDAVLEFDPSPPGFYRDTHPIVDVDQSYAEPGDPETLEPAVPATLSLRQHYDG